MERFYQFTTRGVLSLIAVMLFVNTTFAFSVNIHICQGKFHSIALFGSKQACNKMIAAPVNPGSCCDVKKQESKSGISQRSCCDNKQFSAAAVLEKGATELISFEKVQLITAIANEVNPAIFRQNLAPKKVNETVPAPPLIKIKRQAVLQVFQI